MRSDFVECLIAMQSDVSDAPYRTIHNSKLIQTYNMGLY